MRIQEIEGLARELAEKDQEQLKLYGYIMLKRKRLKHMGRRQARRNLQRRNARGHWILAVQKTIWSRLNCFSTSLSFKPGLFCCKQTFFSVSHYVRNYGTIYS